MVLEPEHRVPPQQRRRLDWLETARRIDWKGPVNTAFFACDVAGELDLDAFGAACRYAVTRHETLRTVFFRDPERGWCARYGAPQAQGPALRIVDSSAYSDDVRPDAVVRSLMQRSVPFAPEVSPRFRVSAIHHSAGRRLLLFEIDRLIADERARSVLFDDLAHAYARARCGALEEPIPDTAFREHVQAELAAPSRPMPERWRAIGRRLIAYDSHADVALPTLAPLDQALAHGTASHAVAVSTEAAAALASAGVAPRTALLAALADVLADAIGDDVRFYLYPDGRDPRTRATVGWFAGRTLVEIPRRVGATLPAYARSVQRLVDEAQTPDGIRWTEEIHDACGANERAPRFPSIAVVDALPPAAFALPDADVTPISIGPAFELGPGRIVCEIDDASRPPSLAFTWERGRFDETLMHALLERTSARVTHIAAAVGE